MAGHAWQPLSSKTEVWFCWTSGSSWDSFTWPFLAAWLEEIQKYIVLFTDCLVEFVPGQGNVFHDVGTLEAPSHFSGFVIVIPDFLISAQV